MQINFELVWKIKINVIQIKHDTSTDLHMFQRLQKLHVTGDKGVPADLLHEFVLFIPNFVEVLDPHSGPSFLVVLDAEEGLPDWFRRDSGDGFPILDLGQPLKAFSIRDSVQAPHDCLDSVGVILLRPVAPQDHLRQAPADEG